MLDINISTPSNIITQLKTKFKQKRLELDFTQGGLAKRSGVSLGSLKRFESSGDISLLSLLKLSLVLKCLDDFQNIACSNLQNSKVQYMNSIDEIINYKDKSIKKRGSIK